MGVFIRTVRTKSGATAVQIVEKRGKQVLNIQHIGSAHTPEQLALLKTAARDALRPGQQAFDLEVPPAPTEPAAEPEETIQPVLDDQLQPRPVAPPYNSSTVPGYASGTAAVTGTSSQLLWDALSAIYEDRGFGIVEDETFKKLVIARIVEPVSKEDSIRVLTELGVPAPSYSTIGRCLKRCVTNDYQHQLATAAFTRAAPTLSLLLYDVTTLYFEAQQEDDLRKPGISKERKLDPQIVVGLLVDQHGYPLELHCFEGNKAEITTMIPVINAFLQRHGLTGLTVVADAGMMSAANMIAMENSGLNFIVGSRTTKLPEQIDKHLDELLAQKQAETAKEQADTVHTITDPLPQTGEELPADPPATAGSPPLTGVDEPIVLQVKDGKIFEETKDVTIGTGQEKITRTYRLVYQYRAKRARLDLRNIQKQIDKSLATLTGTRAIKKDKYVKVTNQKQQLDQALIDKHQRKAGFKGYLTNLPAQQATGAQVIGAYHDLHEVERSFRMSKTDLRGRPIFHRKKDSILAHLSIVFTALAISRTIQQRTGLSIRRVLQILRPLRSAVVQVGGHEIIIPPQIPQEAQEVLKRLQGVH